MDRYLERCIEIIEGSTAGVPHDLATRRVDHRWSVVDIVEHLQRAYSGTAKGLERCLQNDAPSAKAFTLRHKFRTFVVVGAGYFPTGVQAPKHVLPTGVATLEAAIASARRDLDWLDQTAAQAENRFGAVKILDHPILGALTVDQWMRFHWIHTRHHEKQIRTRAGR